MSANKIHIIGAGPAGASLAYFLKDSYKEIIVYDSMKKLGMKPCGWAVPASLKKLVPLPDDYVLTVINGHRVFINNKLVMEEEIKGDWGYIIDKPAWLSFLLREAGVEFKVKNIKDIFNEGITVIAKGVSWEKAPKERINAVQILVEDINWPYKNKVEIWFNTDFIGYYWVFPHSNNRIDVGVGGYKSFNELKTMLYDFILSHPVISGYKEKKLGRLKGAQIIISGIQPHLLVPEKNVYVTGEAAGGVFPLSGEGIRPSVMMSRALADEILGKKDYLSSLKDSGLLFSMKIHRLLLDVLKSLSSEQRLELMKSIPREWVVRFGLGEFNINSLMEMIFRSKGGFSRVIASFLRILADKKVQ